MSSFIMNGYLWRLVTVDPASSVLIDRTGERRVATTDPETQCVYLSRELQGGFLKRVLTHELGHVTMFSYGLLKRLHRLIHPSHWVEVEEWVCNFLADYGEEIQLTASRLLRSTRIA